MHLKSKKKFMLLPLFSGVVIWTLIFSLVLVAYAAATLTVTNNLSPEWQALVTLSATKSDTSAGGSVTTAADGTITLKAKGYSAKDNCGKDQNYTSTTTLTITAKNTIESITFTKDSNVTTSYTGGKIEKGNSVTFTLKSNSGSSSTEVTGKIYITAITQAVVTVDATFQAPTGNGSYTVNGEAITSDTTKSKPSNETYTLVATPDPNNYLIGWYFNGSLYSTDLVLNGLALEQATTIQPRFAEDPLGIVAQLDSSSVTDNTLTKFDFAEFYSYYEPSGYVAAENLHISAPGDYSSFEGKDGTDDNAWEQTNLSNLEWKKADGTTITASRSGTAHGDGASVGNTAGAAKMNAKVLRIKALQTIKLSFNYTVTQVYDVENGTTTAQNAYFYSLKTTSSSPTLSEIKKGTAWGDGSQSSYSGTFGETLGEGEYLYLYFSGFGYNYRPAWKGNGTKFPYSFSSSVSSFTVAPESRTFDFQSGCIDGAGNMIGGGTVSINSTEYTVGSNGLTRSLSGMNGGSNVALEVKTVPSGYVHIGWRIIDGNEEQDVFSAKHAFNIESNLSVYALFSPAVTVTAGSSGFSDATYAYSGGTGPNQYIARTSDGLVFYKSLADAFSATDTVVLVTNTTFEGSFSLPQGKTLSVPYALDDVATTTLQKESGSGNISYYVTATVNGSMTVEGKFVASARQSTSTNQNGKAFGKVGCIKVGGSGNIRVASTGELFAYGAVIGDGTINVDSSGTVYELMEVRDMRDAYGVVGYATGKDYDNILPFSNYYINTNLVSTTYAPGAKLKARYFVNISQVTSDGEIPIIGGYSTSDSSLFMIKSGSLTKGFLNSGEHSKKIFFRAEPGSVIETGKFVVSFTIKVGITYNIDFDTSQKELPLGAGYLIEVSDGGSLTLNSTFKILPGGVLKVAKGGELIVASTGKLILYRANDYDYRSAGVDNYQGFCVNGYPVWFTFPTGVSTKYADLGSAKLIVDGTLDCKGGLYVTNQLNGISTYSNGYNYLTGTGSIIIENRLSNGTIDEQVQRKQTGGNADPSVQTVAYVPIKGLTNYAATEDDHGDTTDDGKTDYTTFTEGTWYGYINGSGINVWSPYAPVTLSYDANGGSGEAPASVRIPAGTELTVAENHFTHSGGKEFGGWNTAADGTGASYSPKEVVVVTQEMGPAVKLYAQWKPITVQIVDAAGTNVIGEYISLQAAVAAYDGNGYIKVLDTITEPGFTIDKNVYLDLNGKTVTLTGGSDGFGTLTISSGCTLHGMDHTTDEYKDTAYGKIIGTVGGEGTVAVTYQTPTAADGTFQRYVKFADTANKALSFHRYNISVSDYRYDFNINGESALYFKGTFSGSNTVKKVLKDVGFEVDSTKVWWTQQGHDLSDVDTPKFEMEIRLTGRFTTEELKHEYTIYALLDFGETDPTKSSKKSLSFWTALQLRYNELFAKDEASRTDKEKAELAVLEQLINGTSNTEQNTVT